MRLPVIMLLACLACAAWAAETLNGGETYQTKATADLNGDGTAETITLAWKKEQKTYTLQVGTLKSVGNVEYREVQGFRIVDLDSSARGKELVVYSAIANEQVFQFYRYTGKTLILLGEFAQEVTIPGAGFIYTKYWCGFWNRLDKYILNHKSSRLELVPQPFNYVGVEGTVLRSLPIYATQAKKTVVAHLQPKSTVMILLNHGDWYLIKSATGLTGWLPEKDITPENFDNLPWGG